MFADVVGKGGRVIAVDISQKFLDHIQKTCREAGQRNVETLLCTADSTEFPLKTMTSLHRTTKDIQEQTSSPACGDRPLS